MQRDLQAQMRSLAESQNDYFRDRPVYMILSRLAEDKTPNLRCVLRKNGTKKGTNNGVRSGGSASGSVSAASFASEIVNSGGSVWQNMKKR